MLMWDVVRAVNVPLLLLASLVLYVRFSDSWPRTSTGWRFMRVGSFTLFLGSAMASALRYVLRAPSDPLVLVGTFAGLLVVVGGWLTRGEDPETRP